MTWRLLLTGPGDPGFNMALDGALAIAVRRGWSPPTLRIFQWRQPTISLGCHQPASIPQALGPASVQGTAVVRRPTAGGAVWHTRDVSYALACNHSALQGHPGRTLYRCFHAALGCALASHRGRWRYTVSRRGAGTAPQSAICFQQLLAGDLMRGRTKVAGAAQRRWRDGLLQQGTVIEPTFSQDRLALCIRAAWADVFCCRFTVGALTVRERVLADELWSQYRPWTPSSWLPGTPDASSRSR